MQQTVYVDRCKSCKEILTDKHLSLWKLNENEFVHEVMTFRDVFYKQENITYINKLWIKMLGDINENFMF